MYPHFLYFIYICFYKQWADMLVFSMDQCTSINLKMRNLKMIGNLISIISVSIFKTRCVKQQTVMFKLQIVKIHDNETVIVLSITYQIVILKRGKQQSKSKLSGLLWLIRAILIGFSFIYAANFGQMVANLQLLCSKLRFSGLYSVHGQHFPQKGTTHYLDHIVPNVWAGQRKVWTCGRLT